MALCPNKLFEVFSYLPAKPIYRFKCINKPDDTCFFIQQKPSQKYSGKVKIFPLLKSQSSCSVFRDFQRFLSKSERVLSSTKVLILCHITNKTVDELFFCNPTTKSWLPIPSPKQIEEKSDADIIMVLLECSNHFDDYIVVHFEDPTDWSSNYGCKFYKPNEGLWKAKEERFSAGGRNMKCNMHVSWNHPLHFRLCSLPD
ncbi:hypothetical protein CR513_60658, partial [Mucuna pruriens]